MRYLIMDNQPNNQKYIKQTSSSSNSVVPENPIPETTPPPQTIPEPQIPVTVENPISTMTEVPASETELPPSQLEPEIEETAPVGEYQNEYQDVLNQYAANQETTAPTLENENLPPTPTVTDSDIFPKPPQNNLFKIIFIISLIIFILTATVLAFIYFKNKNNQKSSSTINNQSSTTNNPAPTNSLDTCFVNDKTYQIGESFGTADGCNTCTCKTQNNISCTDKECTLSKSATESATTITPIKTSSVISTSSAKKTNTSSTSSASTK